MIEEVVERRARQVRAIAAVLLEHAPGGLGGRGDVLRRAQQVLTRLEQQGRDPEPRPDAPQLGLFPPPGPDPLREALADLDPDSLSPRDALEALYQLKKLL